MKFSHRLIVTSLLVFGIFVCVTLISLQGRDELVPDRGPSAVRPELGGVVERQSDTISYDQIPTLLRRVLDQSRSRQLWQTLLRNQSVAEAWIQIGRLLENRKRLHGDRLLIQLEGDSRTRSRFGIHDNQFVLDGVLDRNETDALMRVLYETLGYRKNGTRRRQFGERLLSFGDGIVPETSPSYVRFQSDIRRYALYTDGAVVDELLWDLATKAIVAMTEMKRGTQIKLQFTLADENKAIFKPMRYSRDTETLPDHFYFSDFERHTAEIAAFHLDRVLDFRKVPPVTGRVVNITADIWELATDWKFAKTIFISPAGNVCFHGKCEYYCDTGHAICGRPELVEGSMGVYLSSVTVAERIKWEHPWRRSYSKRKLAKWEKDADYCEEVRAVHPFNETKPMLDIMDMAVFDFLTGNMDRHHYETFADFGNDTFTLLFDNGRGFGKTGHDELSILAPIYQCCMFRASTLNKLLSLHVGQTKLSHLMRQSLANDPLPEVLTERHLAALDRRVEKILTVVSRCLRKDKDKDRRQSVIIDDGF